MTAVSEENKQLARYLLQIFGGKPEVSAYWDESHQFSVDILSCLNQPQAGVTSYATVGLSDHPLMDDGQEFPARVELLAACHAEVTKFPNVLATAAFYIMKDKWFCSPGTIFKRMISEYNLSVTMEHLYFTAPFIWEDSLETLSLKSKTVAWLLAVPISDAEGRYKEQHGSERLEELFEEMGVDIFDLHRSSVV